MDRSVTVACIQLSSQADRTKTSCVCVSAWPRPHGRAPSSCSCPKTSRISAKKTRNAPSPRTSIGATGPSPPPWPSSPKKHALHLIAGGLPEKSGDFARPFNTCAVYGPGGALVTRYRKLHLFDVDLPDGTRYRESEGTAAGDAPIVVDVLGCRVGLSICYDLRFPELYRALSAAGAEVLVVPAAFTLATGKDHWHVLLRARAIEAQAYVLAAAQWGKHSRGRMTFGKSCVVDPWGEIVAQASEGEGMVLARLDPAYLARVRALVPSLCHRRL
jgi:predicted amidohydrolase